MYIFFQKCRLISMNFVDEIALIQLRSVQLKISTNRLYLFPAKQNAMYQFVGELKIDKMDVMILNFIFVFSNF